MLAEARDGLESLLQGLRCVALGGMRDWKGDDEDEAAERDNGGVLFLWHNSHSRTATALQMVYGVQENHTAEKGAFLFHWGWCAGGRRGCGRHN